MIRVHVNPPEGREVPDDLLRRAAEAALRSEGVEEAELSLTLLADDEIADLNRRWLGRDRPTDVIAFPLHEPGEPPLGDVYLGLDQALRQAAEDDIEPDEELVRLAVHGTLHVLGWEHEKGEERTRGEMWMRQEAVVREVVGG